LGTFPQHTLGPLVPIMGMSIVADHVHPFYDYSISSSGGYVQKDNAPCHKAQISNWFLEHDNEFTILKWPPQSQDESNGLYSGVFVNPRDDFALQSQ